MRKGGGEMKARKTSAETQEAAMRSQFWRLLTNIITALVIALAKLLLKDWLS